MKGRAIARDFQVAAEGVAAAFERIVDRLAPDAVFAVNGLFAPEDAIRSVAAQRGLPIVTYELAPRKDALIFGRECPAPDMVMDGLAEDQASRPLSTSEAAALDALLEARVSGESAHERYFGESLQHEGETVRAALQLPGRERIVSAFTNLSWDTALLGKDVAFESQFAWLADTCRIVGKPRGGDAGDPDPPGRGPVGDGRSPFQRELAARLGDLPRNVIVVPPDQPLSSYGLLALSDVVLCYTTTVGLEAAVRGDPGRGRCRSAVYRGRGFTSDIASLADLRERVLADPPPMTPEQIELARRYAFAFFFRLMIPFRHVGFPTVGA